MAHAEAWAAGMFARLDGDGEVVAADLPGPSADRMLAMSDRVDADGDGVVSAEEIEAAGPHRRHGGGQGGHRFGGRV